MGFAFSSDCLVTAPVLHEVDGGPSLTVGLVIPVYGDPSLMTACFESVLSQSRPFDQVVVVDDDSPDPDVAPLTQRYAELGGWHVIRLESNGGIVAASNLGLEMSTTDYVAFLDCDDELSALAHERMRAAADDGDKVDAVFSRYATFVDGAETAGSEECNEGVPTAPSKLTDPGLFELREYYGDDSHLVLEHLFCSHFKMFRTEWLRGVGGFPAGSDGVQDWFIGVRAIRESRVSLVPEVLYYHRIHGGQTTHSARARFLRAVNGERRRWLSPGRPVMTAELGRQVLSLSRRLSESTNLRLLPAFLLVSQRGALSMHPANLDTFDALTADPATEWVIISGNAWFHLGASRCFAEDKERPPVGIAVRSDCEHLIYMCRWYSGYADFVVCMDAESDLLLEGYLPRETLSIRVTDEISRRPSETIA